MLLLFHRRIWNYVYNLIKGFNSLSTAIKYNFIPSVPDCQVNIESRNYCAVIFTSEKNNKVLI